MLSALVGMALYAVTLGGTWVYDDIYHLFNDDRTQLPEVQPGSGLVVEGRTKPAIEDPRQWGRYLTESYNDGIDNLYRPVTSLSFVVQATVHGRGEEFAWLWHLVNVLLYGVVCAQVALLAGRLAESGAEPANIERQSADGVPDAGYPDPGSRRFAPISSATVVAACAGILFATHPVHVEAVAGIVGRAEMICAIGFLGGLLVLMRPLTPRRIVAFAALMLLAIGGKEQGLVLPAVALVWYLSRRWSGLPSLTQAPISVRETSADRPEGQDFTSSLPYEPAGAAGATDLGKWLIIAVALPLAGYLVLREQVLGLSMAWPVNLLDPTIQTMRDAAGLDRWLMPVALAGRYLHLLAWPHRLSIDYGATVIAPPQRLDDPYLWLGFLAIALLLAAVVHALRTRWAAGLTMLAAFAFTYGLVSNGPKLIGTVFGERLMFLPSAFFIMYLVLLAQLLLPGRRSVRPLIGLVLLAAMLGAIRSFTYAARWNDRVEFYAYQARVQPQSLRIWMLLGEELRQRGRFEEAAAAAERATDIQPDYWSHWMLRANIAAERGRLEEALEYAERAVEARTAGNTTALRARIEDLIHQRDQGLLPAPPP